MTIQQALQTDLYQLTMAAAYFENEVQHQSTFEMYVRRLPPQRSFLVVAGLEPVLQYLHNLHFGREEIAYLRRLPMFKGVSSGFWEYLAAFRFTGDVWAVPEGTVVFPYEPFIRITAPVIEAQLVETFVLSVVNFQTMIASKAARVYLAATMDGKERTVYDFGTRRAHGPEAGVGAARASYIGGCQGTSNVYAGFHLGLPVVGTAAHSWTMAFDSEVDAFERYLKVFPDHTTLLIDTYDTLHGAKLATDLGPSVKGVRLDSGDFAVQSKQVRAILDEGGLKDTRIVVSGDMNEYKIADLIKAQAPIDSFGVGTEMVTSYDAPALGGVYKLVEQQQPGGQVEYKVKLSSQKVSYPGAKQVYRVNDEQGVWHHDVLALALEPALAGAQPLLQQVMAHGQQSQPLPSLAEIQQHTRDQLKQLPLALQALNQVVTYPVERSETLEKLYQQLQSQSH